MGSVKAMAMDICCEKSSHVVTPMAPNVCITPAAPSPLPLPYPNLGTTSKLDPKTKKVKFGKKGTLNSKSKVKKINGNEPGTQKDITTMKTNGAAWPLPVPAVTIHFEGAPIAITGSPGFSNSM